MVLLEVVIVVEEKKNGVVISASSISFNLSAHSDIISSGFASGRKSWRGFSQERVCWRSTHYEVEYLVVVDPSSC